MQDTDTIKESLKEILTDVCEKGGIIIEEHIQPVVTVTPPPPRSTTEAKEEGGLSLGSIIGIIAAAIVVGSVVAGVGAYFIYNAMKAKPTGAAAQSSVRDKAMGCERENNAHRSSTVGLENE